MVTTPSGDRPQVPVPGWGVEQTAASARRILAQQRCSRTTRFAWKVGVFAVAALVPAGCGSPSSSTATAASTAPIDVVASTNVWGDIAKQIGGDHVNVTSILSDPNADPHQFEADAKTAAATEQGAVRDREWLGLRRFHGQAARGVAQRESERR